MKLEAIDKGAAFDFGRVSEKYAGYRDIYPASLYQTLIEAKVVGENMQVLDLGSGTGVLPRRLYHTGARFTVTDVSENQIDQARRLAAEADMENMDFRVCGAEDTGFSNAVFDAVTAAQCFHYFNAEKAAAEIARVLKPEGLFCKIFMEWLPLEDEKV
ncbi:MAG: class I SAM-dependent methyltransferase, partial [Oscillospiraceae bacterium]|nr:class I SAM-dependent methyltransferase [Oscillospiraceae bacterium]